MEAKLKILTKQYDEVGNIDTIEVNTIGKMFEKNKDIYIVYEESEENQKVTTTLKISEEEVSIKRFGNVNSLMIFKENHKNLTKYKTNQGLFVIETETNKLTIDKSKNNYIKLNVEKYGGMIYTSWLDKPLSVAGRIVVKSDSGVETKCVNIDRDLLSIPSLAIHMNREVNDGYKFNPQKDMLPLFGDSHNGHKSFIDLIAAEAEVTVEDILGTDLFLYNRMKGSIWGRDSEYFSCPRIDNLESAYLSLKALLNSESTAAVQMLCVFDNEEVGSGTKQGAASTFLFDTLIRVHEALGYDGEDYRVHLADSFMISADNAHAVHPNYTEKADPTNRPYLNEGIVLKFNANQKYCTDAVSAAMFRDLCKRADVPVQTFTNRSDMAGGSTLGNISNTQVALNTVDIGLPQLAMHSPYETAGVKDTEYLVRAAKEFFC